MKAKFLLTSLLLAASFSLMSCKKNNSEPVEEKEEQKDKIVLNATNVELRIGDTYHLYIAYSDVLGEAETTYKSSNNNILTVDNYGLVYAVKEGKAEVEVAKGNARAICKFTISFASEIPYIVVDGIVDNHIEIDTTSTYRFDAKARFGESLFDIDNATYEAINDEGEGYFEGNVFHPTKKGSLMIKIGGAFKEYQMHNYYVSVLVKESVIFTLREPTTGTREYSEIDLFTIAEYKGNTYFTSFKLAMSVSVDGIDKSDELTFEINENDVISFDSTENVITSIKSGEASLVMRYEGYSKTVPIYVNYLKDECLTEGIVIDASIGEFPTSDIFSDFVSDQEIIKATSVDEKEEYEVVDGKVLGIKSHNFAEQKIIVYNKSIGFIVSFKAYAKILKEAKDLEEFTIDFGSDTNAVQKFQNDGYYIVANDIDCNGYTYPKQTRMLGFGTAQVEQKCGFTGTFDGQGHKISNFKTPQGGLFLILGIGSIVRNVAFVDAVLDTTNNDRFVLATYCYGAEISNVYISSSSEIKTVNNAMVAASIMPSCTLKYCLFEYTGAVNVERNYGSLMHIFENSSPLFESCYVVSETVLTRNTNYYGDLNVIEKFSDLTFKQYEGGIKRFNNYDEMRDANEDFSMFNDDLYWDYSSGILSWK